MASNGTIQTVTVISARGAARHFRTIAISLKLKRSMKFVFRVIPIEGHHFLNHRVEKLEGSEAVAG